MLAPRSYAEAGQSPPELKVELPDDLASIQVEPAPFDWAHADLEPIREYLQQAQAAGKFLPQTGLPL